MGTLTILRLRRVRRRDLDRSLCAYCLSARCPGDFKCAGRLSVYRALVAEGFGGFVPDDEARKADYDQSARTVVVCAEAAEVLADRALRHFRADATPILGGAPR